MEIILEEFHNLNPKKFQVFFSMGSYFLSFLLTLPFTNCNKKLNGYSLEDRTALTNDNFFNNPLNIFKNFWKIVEK